MKDKDLDRIEAGIEALMNMLQEQGKIGIFAFYITREGGELVDANVTTTEIEPLHGFQALGAWADVLSQAYADADEDNYDDEPKQKWKK